MSPELLSIAALVCFIAGTTAAIAGFRVEMLRTSAWQFGFVGLGLLLKTAAIGMTCAHSPTHFFNSPGEIAALLAWSLAFSFLVALASSSARSLGALILPFVVVLMILSLVLSREGVDHGMSPSRYLAPHILAAFLGYGLFLTACGASVLYLEQTRLLKRKMFNVIFRDLPSLERLERLEILCAWLGLAAFTVAIATGAIMANELNRPFWLQPKMIATELTWLIFAALLVGRAVRRLNGRSAAKFVLAGAALVLCTFLLSHPFARPQAATANVPAKGRSA
ncbi:MAG TPA: cytochrome c biogenesis protein CcsA [Planctomycetota bacterium]|nr:cytochrome c biogenesis protein CcsA [Planctomycetota bacterium]